MRCLFLVLLLVGCEDDLLAGLDAGEDTCEPATTAPPTITLRGTISELVNNEFVHPFEGVTYDVLRSADDAVIASTVTAADGTWSIVLPTNGVPLDVYTRWTAPGYTTWGRSFGAPLHEDHAWDDDALNTWEDFVSYNPSAIPDHGTIHLMANDCSGQPITDLSPTLTPASGGLVSDPPAVWAINVPTGVVEIASTHAGGQLPPVRAHVFVGVIELEGWHP